MPYWQDSDAPAPADISKTFQAPIEVIDHALAAVQEAIRTKALRRSTPALRRDLPYALHPLRAAGRVILVNRNYKPCGSSALDFADYEGWPAHHCDLTEAEVHMVCPRAWRLFNDGNPPWASRAHASAYVERLGALRALLAA